MTKKTAIRDVDQPFFTYFQALYLSFFSAKLYVDVGKRWRGIAMRYLFLLMAIVSLPLGLSATLNFRHFLEAQVINPLMQLPVLKVTEGQITIDKPMPYEIKNEQGEVVIFVDTGEKKAVMDTTKYPALMLAITQNSFVFQLPGINVPFNQQEASSQKNSNYTGPGTMVQRLSPNTTQIIDFKPWLESRKLRMLEYTLLFLVYPCFLAMLFTLNLLFLLAFGFMAQFVARLFMRFKLSYKQAVRLLIVSFTPYAFFGSFLSVTHFKVPVLSIILILLWGGYYMFAVRALRNESNKLVFFS